MSVEAKLEIEEDDYVEQFKPFMMDIVAAWCKGASFGEVCKMTDLFEGIVLVVFSHSHSILLQL